MMLSRTHALAILDKLEAHIALAETELRYRTPFELLVAVILSAQCTDVRVNATTPALFEAYPTPNAMAAADEEALFSIIKSISYPRNKTRHLIGMSRQLLAYHDGKVPSSIDALRALPGVGRKTAHVVASILYKAPVIAVDTHVFRVAHRLGLAPQSARTPRAVEDALCRRIPSKRRAKAHHLLILHGRYCCKARKPNCKPCVLHALCPYPNKNMQ